MPKDKYNILAKTRSSTEGSPAKEGDLTLELEASLVLSGTKYPEPRTRIAFSFISTSKPGVIRLFFVTITHSRSNREYYGFDASESCVVISPDRLEAGKRYEAYGRLGRKEPKTLYCVDVKEICYRRLCYEIF
ncbi:hypothetical protein [Encephalitozoon cuniculi GB-M1]|uniref:Uncharacterized protein n=1 Tax=Encephalitozoon cuniculi (strain GB-M1) TaxID=284813 RepID=Q8SU43_ENCCU|nr:uncharacterized protein ECU11_1010 [Encephalitozoon cuniculi GB-M1]CAD26011.1 hypothetical protein [Encephalitozoon cuniculi GB-M1]